MVNLGKRMRRLKPLLHVRSGQGAALLPKPPSPSSASPEPYLTHVHLTFPVGPFDTAVHGARLFWRNHLCRLKYHNPSLPVTVEHGPGHLGSPMVLRLVFEGTDVERLRVLARASERPRKRGLLEALTAKELTEEEKEELARKQSPNWRDAPRRENTVAIEERDEWERDEWERDTEGQEMEKSAQRERRRTADDDEVVLKEPQPPASANLGEAPPAPIYTRGVTLGVKDRTASQIWHWFKMRTNCTELPRIQQDQSDYDKLSGVLRRSALDRARVKKGVDERKANDEMLRRARGEVEKLRAEA